MPTHERFSSSSSFSSAAAERGERRFCELHGLSWAALSEARDLKATLMLRLRERGLVPSNARPSTHESHESQQASQPAANEPATKHGVEATTAPEALGEERNEEEEEEEEEKKSELRGQAGAKHSGESWASPTKKPPAAKANAPEDPGFVNRWAGQGNVVAAVIAAGLYPNLAVASRRSAAAAAIATTVTAASANLPTAATAKKEPLAWACGRRGGGGKTQQHGAHGGGGGGGGDEGKGGSSWVSSIVGASDTVHLHRESVNFGAKSLSSRWCPRSPTAKGFGAFAKPIPRAVFSAPLSLSLSPNPWLPPDSCP